MIRANAGKPLLRYTWKPGFLIRRDKKTINPRPAVFISWRWAGEIRGTDFSWIKAIWRMS
jgi:hypothetical protein